MTVEQAFLAGAPRAQSPQAPPRLRGARPGLRAVLPTWGALALLLAAALLPAHRVCAAQLNGLALESAPGGARLVLKMSGPVGARLFHLKAPERAVLDLDNTQLAAGAAAPHAAGIVQAVRVGRQPGGVLRVVLQLSGSYPARASWTTTTVGRPGGRMLIVSVGSLSGGSSAPAVRAPGSRTPAIRDPAGGYAAAPASSAPGASSAAVASSEPIASSAVSSAPAPAAVPATAGEPVAPSEAVSAVALPDENAVPVPVPVPGPAPDPGPRTVRPAHAPTGTGRDIIVAVDAGHGGIDPGAIGHGGTREKDVTLAIASLLAARINREPGMRAILTRGRDEFVVLRDRIQRARESKADMFVSVHADAARNSEASGASVYVLSETGASSENARWLAERENAADLIGGVKLDNKDRTLASVLLDLSQRETISSSIEAAERVLACLDGVEEVRRSQVQQAGFVVLKSPDIPSMLVETAYISNPQDEQRLRRPAEQERLAQAIFTGVRRYFADHPPEGTRLSAVSRAGTQPRKKA